MRTELAVLGVSDADVEAALAKIEYSRATHVEWRDHIRACGHCQQNPPEHVHQPREQERIITEYDRVLKVLRAVQYVTKQEHTVTIDPVTAKAEWASHG